MGRSKRSTLPAEQEHGKWVKKMQKKFLSSEAAGYSCSNCHAACAPNNWLYHVMTPKRGVLCFYSIVKHFSNSDNLRGPILEHTMDLGQSVKLLSGIAVKVEYDIGISKEEKSNDSQKNKLSCSSEKPDVDSMASGKDEVDGQIILENQPETVERKANGLNSEGEKSKWSANGNENNNNNSLHSHSEKFAHEQTDELYYTELSPEGAAVGEPQNPLDGDSRVNETIGTDIKENVISLSHNVSTDEESDESDLGHSEQDQADFGKKYTYTFPDDDEEKRYFCVNCVMSKGTQRVKNEVYNICLEWGIEINKVQ